MIHLSPFRRFSASRALGCSEHRPMLANGRASCILTACRPKAGSLIQAMIAALVLVAVNVPAQAQFKNWVNLERVDRDLQGQLVDYTSNHGPDRRIFSPILQMPRDLYVYLPPGYDPNCAYPLILFLHMANVDEHYFVGSNVLRELEKMMLCGAFPPAIVACPDGTITGVNHYHSKHSLYVNGVCGQFEDHIMQEVVPFLMTHYAIRPERQAHALLGLSGGGYGAMNLAIKYRSFFATVAVMAAPLNMRYSDCVGGGLADFNPATYCWKTTYDPDEVIATYYCGLWKTKASKFIAPVFGDGPDVVSRIVATNPADLLFIGDLQPCQLAMYAHYPGRDNFNLDAHAQCFQWLAAQKGVEVTLACDPEGTHNHSYFRDNICPVLAWLGPHVLPPGVPMPLVGPPPADSPQAAVAPMPAPVSVPTDSTPAAAAPKVPAASLPTDALQGAAIAPKPPAASPPLDLPQGVITGPLVPR
jgi:S-formylglutathione hydrolase FrmB